MHGDDNPDETTNNSTESENQLVLFSLIVALSSPVSHTSIPFQEGATEDQHDLQRYLKDVTALAASEHKPRSNKKATQGSVSTAFLSIRRVHISLARYCRVLEREEKRCQYVTEQVKHFFRIRSEYQKNWEQQQMSTSVPTAQEANKNISNSSSVISTNAPQIGTERRSRNSVVHNTDDSLVDSRNMTTSSIKQEQEKEQDILELMLATFQDESKQHKQKGNLVRELIQVFHSLSRNDYEFPPTPDALLSERDGVVYVNQHIAVPIEAASLRPSQLSSDGPLVRPYYTLLFPHASPSELLQAFQSSGSAAPQRLQQLLLTVNPQKPLSEIAVDANLPLHTTLEIASYLVAHGACVTSPVVSRNSRLSCLQIEKIPQLALEFSQIFANVSFFRLVGFLTSNKTLGEAMSVLTDVESEEAIWLRECLSSSGSTGQQHLSAFHHEDQPTSGTTGQTQLSEQLRRRWVEELEELLYAMTIWLLSHRVLTQTQEYFVVADSSQTPGTTSISSTPPIPSRNTAIDADENLFRELLESDYLNGDVSIVALSWKFGLDQQKLRSWGIRHKRVRLFRRNWTDF